jgi:hypothetical protein
MDNIPEFCWRKHALRRFHKNEYCDNLTDSGRGFGLHFDAAQRPAATGISSSAWER